jgi:uncharacterized protein
MAETRQPGTSKRGFASMDRQKQREIARKGGESVPAEKRSFSQNHELAAQAGRKGGQASQGSRNSAMRGNGDMNRSSESFPPESTSSAGSSGGMTENTREPSSER